jgi:hypothetical protein
MRKDSRQDVADEIDPDMSNHVGDEVAPQKIGGTLRMEAMETGQVVRNAWCFGEPADKATNGKKSGKRRYSARSRPR